MKVQDLIQKLLPFKDLNLEVVIVDGQETLISSNIDVCLTPDYLVDNIYNENAVIQDKYITAILNYDDNVIGEVVYLRLEDFYLETDHRVNEGREGHE